MEKARADRFAVLFAASAFAVALGFVIKNVWLTASALTVGGLVLGAWHFSRRKIGLSRARTVLAAVNSFGGVVLLLVVVWGVAAAFIQMDKWEAYASKTVGAAYAREVTEGACIDVRAFGGEFASQRYRAHCEQNGPALSWRVEKSYAQILGTPSGAVVRVKRPKGTFEEVWSFNHSLAFSFGVTTP